MKGKKRFISLLLVFVLSLSMVACSDKDPAKTESKTESKTEAKTEGTYTPGTYTGSAQGFDGIVQVTITVDDEKITEVKAEGPNETEGIGTMALEEIPAKIVEKNSADVDVISGATYTSEGIIAAANEAISLAKGEEQAAKEIVDGKYVVDVIGHEGMVTVCTQFVEGAIASVEVLTHDETQGIGSFAVDRIPGRIVEAQSVNVDAVTGATVTSNVIKQAVSQAITEANGDILAFNDEPIREEIVEENIEENVQVAIMGAGTAGIFAAVQLLEQGVEDVILFEKQEIPGGSMPTTYGGIVLSDSEVFNNWTGGNPMFGNWDSLKTAFLAGPDKDNENLNPELPYSEALFTKAGELYDWMSNIGIGFTTLGSRPGHTYPFFAPGAYQGGTGYAMEFLVKRIEDKGGRIIYNTPVTDFIKSEDGRITGLIAEGKDGKNWTVNADAVIVASGSFAKNQELVEKYFPEWSDNYFNTIESLTGDGLLLGMEYGAGIEGMGNDVPGFLASYDSHFELAFMHMTTPGIIVNLDGDQFGDITRDNHSTMAKAKADPANKDTFYYIFDDAAAVQTRDSKDYGFRHYKAIFEKGEAKRYDSLEACQKELGLKNLGETIAENNRLSIAGEVDEWGRKNLPYIDTREGVWAIRVDPNPYLTTGGLKINTSGQVLTEEGEIIPGLFAAGDVCGSVEQKDGRTYAYGFDAAMTYGAIVAETIANQLLNK